MKPKPSTTAPALDPGVVAIVLSGWTAVHAAASESDAACFDLFQSREHGILQVWAHHEAFLRAEAVRLGIEPQWPMPGGRRGFFGEALAVATEIVHSDEDLTDD